MTPKQKAFCDYYIKLGNGAESAKRAGYKAKNLSQIASENLTKPYIKQYIDDRIEKKDKKRIASQDEVLEYYTRLMRGEEKESQVVVTPTGDVIENNVKPTLKERTKGADALAKRYGMDKMVEREVEESVKIVIVPRK